MKKLLTVFVIVAVALVVLSFVKDAVIKTSVEKGVEIVTGLKLQIQAFRMGVINQLVGIRNLKLFNPRGFKDRVMLDVPEIYVDYNLPAIIEGKVHIEDMRIDMREFMVVKNEKGELNLDSLKVVEAQKAGERPAAKKGSKALQIQVDSLELKIGRVIYKDYSLGEVPSVKEFDINLDESYKNIRNPYAVVSLIVVKALMNTTIASLTGFDLSGLEGTISDTLASAQKVAAEAVQKAQEVAEEATQKAREAAEEAQKKAEEAVKGAEETLKKTTEDLKKIFKSPFGAKEE